MHIVLYNIFLVEKRNYNIYIKYTALNLKNKLLNINLNYTN